MEKFTENLNELMKQCRSAGGDASPCEAWNDSTLAEAMGDVSRTKVAAWRSGKRYPDVKELRHLARLLDVTVAVLVGEESAAVTHQESEVLRLARLHGLDRAADILYAAIPPPSMDPKSVRIEQRDRRGRDAAN